MGGQGFPARGTKEARFGGGPQREDDGMAKYNAAMLKLVEGDETPARESGADVLRDVAQLIADRLPGVPCDDPHRGVLSALRSVAPRR